MREVHTTCIVQLCGEREMPSIEISIGDEVLTTAEGVGRMVDVFGMEGGPELGVIAYRNGRQHLSGHAGAYPLIGSFVHRHQNAHGPCPNQHLDLSKPLQRFARIPHTRQVAADLIISRPSLH